MRFKKQYTTPAIYRTTINSLVSEGNYAMNALTKHLDALVAGLRRDLAYCLEDLRACVEAGDKKSATALRKQYRKIKKELTWHETAHAHSGDE